MWMKKSTPKLSGPDSPLLGLIGFIPMHEETGYDGLCIQWLTEEERVMGGPSMTFMIMAVRFPFVYSMRRVRQLMDPTMIITRKTTKTFYAKTRPSMILLWEHGRS
jgi:hypothetical protein